MNPFEEITNRLDKIERLISRIQPINEKKNRYVSLSEFATYSGMSPNTIYAKISRGNGIPGAFKSGPKNWLFDLDAWDNFLEKKRAEFQPA